jgi:SAM-dependent methyltransferase
MITGFPQGNLRFVTCAACRSVYQNPRPCHDSMQEFYRSAGFFRAGRHFVGFRDHDAERAIRTKTAEFRLDAIEAARPGPLRILDVACGYAAFVRLARERGHDAIGIDYSSAMINGAKRENGVDLIDGDFVSHDFGTRRFDVICLYGAVQNFLNLRAVTAAVRRWLAPDGLYCTNAVMADAAIERVQGARFWNYRPPIIYIPTLQAFEAAHVGMQLVGRRREVQHVTANKLATFVLNRPVQMPFGDIAFPLTIPTGYWRFMFRRRD